MCSTGLPPAVRKPGSVGPAVGAEVAVLDEEGHPTAANVEGEICIRGKNLMAGYIENPTANQESFRDGWFYTGDRGRMDADGHLFVTGRTKEILNRGGEKISGQEIDYVLMDHPAVQQCLTFALPDSRLGDEVGVVVVRRTGAAVEEAELQNFVAERLAEFKVPRRVFFLETIPTGSTGKLQRIGLAERLGITADSWKPVQEAPVSADAELTSAVARIIANVLQRPDIGPDTAVLRRRRRLTARGTPARPPRKRIRKNPDARRFVSCLVRACHRGQTGDGRHSDRGPPGGAAPSW